jgi:hypothetical protein
MSVDVFTAAIRAPSTQLVIALEFAYNQGDPDYVEPVPLPAAADGDAILFYAVCETEYCIRRLRGGAILRLVGHRWRRLAKVTPNPVGLGLSGRRFAVATKNARCCNDTPTWSHDGTRLAWIYRDNLWTVRADKTDDRQLATRASLPSWAPNDKGLVFERVDARNRHEVYRINSTGGGLRRLALGNAPEWSPDGTKIAFIRGKDVFAVDPDGRGAKKLTATQRPTAARLSWSPDSTRIAVSRGGYVYSIRADGTGEQRLTQGSDPAWSPNGARIAYAGNGIGVVNADGTGAARLTAQGADVTPVWSPDSSRVAFVRKTGGGGELWVTSADGGGARRLARSSDLLSPQWAPNGTSIAVGEFHGDGDLPYDAGIRLVSPVDGKVSIFAPVLHTTVEIGDAITGWRVKRLRLNGHARSIALTPDYLALLVDHLPGVRIEVYDLDGRLRTAAAVPTGVEGEISAAGRSVVFAAGRAIRRVDARTGVVATLATARGRLVGPIIEGRRVVWADSAGRTARIRAVTAP